jgi:hypothetical protein
VPALAKFSNSMKHTFENPAIIWQGVTFVIVRCVLLEANFLISQIAG